MARTSEAYRREHAITRAWQRHGVELNGAGYDAIAAQVKHYGDALCIFREAHATHHCIFIQKKALVVVWDEQQHRVRTVLPRKVGLTIAVPILRSRVAVTRIALKQINALITARR